MADPADRSRFVEAAPGLLAQAARAALGAALAPAAGDGDTAMPAWIERLLAPFRPMLGDLAGALPRILARVRERTEGTDSPVLLFRISDGTDAANSQLARLTGLDKEGVTKALLTRLPDPDEVWVTKALRARLKDKLKGLPLDDALTHLDDLTRDPRRLDLPQLLDKLKHAVRADRVTGLELVHKELDWMFGNADHRSAYELMDRLSDALGESNLRELRRHHRIDALLSSKPVDRDVWREPLDGLLSSIGCPPSAALSVVRTGGDVHASVFVHDHDLDRRHELRFSPGTQQDEMSIEVFGQAPGCDYTHLDPRLRLPMRIHDAANGFATWLVDRRAVHESRACFPRDGDLRMRAFDAGGQRTPVALFFVHHRDTDAGRYFELGLGCFVAPLQDPLSVGMAALDTILVSTERGARLGSAIWGWDKLHVEEPHWEVSYRPASLTCAVTLPGARIALTLPRGGSVCTTAMPALLYTRKPAADGAWHRSAMLRSGRGEMLRIAGAGVELKVTITDKDEALAQPLLRELYRLDLIDAGGNLRLEPDLAAWSEHVEAQVGPPLPLPLPEPVFD